MEDKMAHKHQNQKGISAALVRAECTASVSFNVPNIQEHYETIGGDAFVYSCNQSRLLIGVQVGSWHSINTDRNQK